MSTTPKDAADVIAAGGKLEPYGTPMNANGGKVVSMHRGPSIVYVDTDAIFAPLPPTPWKVRGLHIGPGRPTLIAGYGASAKTLSAQAMALAVASGKPIWGHFEGVTGEVRHLDYEQGFHASAKRYQRLAIGMGIERADLGDRLKLCALPRVFLDDADAADAYARACEGADVVILDALRGAAPSHDENDSRIRSTLDVLTSVSERTGAAFVVLHHAGKPKDGHADARTVARGSSAIFDACGCVLLLSAGKTGSDPKRVSQVKTPADAEGAPIEDFELVVEDVMAEGDRTAGVRVVHRVLELEDADANANAAFERDAEKLLATIRKHPGSTSNLLVQQVAMGRNRALQVLAALADENRVRVIPGDRGAKTYRVIS